MPPNFGTSGLRGLVTELTPVLVADYVRAFLNACPTGTGLYVGRDLRPSSPEIARAVINAARGEGVAVTDCGAVPTPALALAAMGAGAAAVMVTGSHIPADRNGLKFYTPGGEITKADESSITSSLGIMARGITAPLSSCDSAGTAWVMRYVDAFGRNALTGHRIGVWSHSAVSRDFLLDCLRALGANVIEVGRTTTFVPLDTEALPEPARHEIHSWVKDEGLTALVSTDGDGDRPLLSDENGSIVPGDLLGQITAHLVGAHTVVTPLSSNTGVELSGNFAQVLRTRIGSPYVIAGLKLAGDRAVGYEANGGFILGFDAQLTGKLPRLLTRDSLLPLVAILSATRTKGTVSKLVSAEPSRFTATDRIENVPNEISSKILREMTDNPSTRANFVAELNESIASVDTRDGLRLSCQSGKIIHLRPSGNAPELRVYAEGDNPETTATALREALVAVKRMVSTKRS